MCPGFAPPASYTALQVNKTCSHGRMFEFQIRKCPAWFTIFLIATCLQAAADQPPPRVNVVELLRLLPATGVDVLYSTELVPPSLDAPESVPGSDPMSRVVAAL